MLHRLKEALVLLCLATPVPAVSAPDLVLRDFEGRPRPVREFIGQGKWTVVTVWSADCPICRREIHHMTFFYDEHRKGDVTVLGFSIDGEENRQHALEFAREHGLNFPNLLGDWRSVERLTGVSFKGTPTLYVFTPRGDYVAQRIGPASQEDVEALIRKLKSDARKPG